MSSRRPCAGWPGSPSRRSRSRCSAFALLVTAAALLASGLVLQLGSSLHGFVGSAGRLGRHPRQAESRQMRVELLAEPGGGKPAEPGGGKLAGAPEDLGDILDELEVAAKKEEADEEAPAEPTMMDKFKESFGWVLVADVFIAIFFAGWFLFGTFLRYSAGFDPVLNLFLTLWDPYIQPVLGVLFAARLLAIIFSQVSEAFKTDDDRLEELQRTKRTRRL
eukprot:TRINITY_DN64538_c0_g1_i1.p1 TRINITY_DN64538_c0_g1~~TRINITY_DN64538_c0_g1_i1.p1  ORF type:complete len:220 (+),score=64.14 TRINITY_DN64538_c0_g1_i1:74-733(+)